MGREFVRKFNWIIDFKNEKVFIEQINANIGENHLSINIIKKLKNLALVINDNLIVISSNYPNIKKGSVLKKINKETVTSSNICEFERLLLTNSESWDKLDIEF